MSTRNGSPRSTFSKTTSAPNGARAAMCALSASYAEAADWPGAIRALTLALTTGTSVFEAFCTLGRSMPVTVIDGWFQIRSRIGPRPIGVTPSRSAASARSCASG